MIDRENHRGANSCPPELTEDRAPSSQGALLVQALEEYLAALESGRRPDRSEFLARYPEIATLLAEPLTNLELLQAATPSLRQHAAGSTAASPVLTANVPLGDYHILREIGRGGMGVVYEAEQLSLGRRVALKVLPWAASLDARQLQRFKNEAHAAAQLHHSNIVPVFGVGCERGIHYYTMQFIEGQSVADLIDELRNRRGRPSAERGSTAALSKTASASSEPVGSPVRTDANACGPQSGSCGVGAATPLVMECSENGPAFFRTVARFGVQAAEALEHAHRSGIVHRDIKPGNLLIDPSGNLWITDFGLAQVQGDAPLTTTGDIVGTLRYMSPEQALAQCGLLDQRTDIYSLGVSLYELLTLEPALEGRDQQELMHQIASVEPRPLRRLNSAVPADLETILLKAFAKEPGSRYGTAQEMADDLRRFLADEPIKARRPTPMHRAAKWCRRHRAVVSAVAVVGIAGLVASTLVFWRGQTQTEAQRQRAQEKLELARTAVDDMYVRAQKLLHFEPQMEEVQNGLLDKALHFYEQFSQETGTDPDTRFKQARAFHRIAEIQLLLGQIERRRWQDVAAAPAEAKAAAAAEEATTQLKQLVADFPDEASYQGELAGCHFTHAQALKYKHKDQSEQAYRASADCYEALAARFPDQPSYARNSGVCYQEIGMLLQAPARRPRHADAAAAYARARDLFQKLVDDDSSNVEDRNRLAAVYADWGRLQLNTGQHAQAEKSLETAVRMLDQLSADFEVLPDSQHQHGGAYFHLGMLFGIRRPAESEAAYQKAVEAFERLVVSHPRVPRYQGSLGLAQDGLAQRLRARGELARARELEEKAISHDQAARQANPQNTEYRVALQMHYHNLGDVLLDLGEYRKAGEAAVGAADIIPGCPIGANHATQIYARCVAQLQDRAPLKPSERKTLKKEYTDRTLPLVERIITSGRGNPILENDAAWHLATFPDDRVRNPGRAADLAEKAVERIPRSGAMWNTLGVARYRKGDWKGAAKALQKATELDNGAEPVDGFFLAMAQWQLGHKDEARACYERAAKIHDRGFVTDEEFRRFRDEARTLLGVKD